LALVDLWERDWNGIPIPFFVPIGLPGIFVIRITPLKQPLEEFGYL
jgi:hypothetical protein